VLTGDIHSAWVHDLKADFDEPASATLGTEFVGTSVTSDFPPLYALGAGLALADNPHTKFFDAASRGYVRCTLTQERWQADFRAVETVATPGAPVRTLASFVVENGRLGAQRV